MRRGKGEKEMERGLVPYRAEWPVFEEMDTFFDKFFRRPFFWPDMRVFGEAPPALSADIFEEGDDVVLKAEVPGISKEDIEVNIADNRITVSGEKKKEEKVQRKDYYKVERSYGSFKRSFALPAEVQSAKAKATFKDGVLEVRMPKTEEAKKKAIKVAVE